MIWLDLEGTIIDDLTNRNWLNKNINDYILNQDDTFGIFTWGWFSADEIDVKLIKLIEKKLKMKFAHKVITKLDCMAFEHNHKWFWSGDIEKDFEAECSFNEKFTKEACFIDMFKHSDGSINILFDDSIEDNFLDARFLPREILKPEEVANPENVITACTWVATTIDEIDKFRSKDVEHH